MACRRLRHLTGSQLAALLGSLAELRHRDERLAELAAPPQRGRGGGGSGGGGGGVVESGPGRAAGSALARAVRDLRADLTPGEVGVCLCVWGGGGSKARQGGACGHVRSFAFNGAWSPRGTSTMPGGVVVWCA